MYPLCTPPVYGYTEGVHKRGTQNHSGFPKCPSPLKTKVFQHAQAYTTVCSSYHMGSPVLLPHARACSACWLYCPLLSQSRLWFFKLQRFRLNSQIHGDCPPDRISVTFLAQLGGNVTDYVTEMSLIHFGLFTDRHERLEQQYGNQLEICKAVMQHLTGKPVKEALLSI